MFASTAIRLLALSVTGVVLVTACGTTSSTESPPTTVRLLTHESFVVSDALIAEFERDTGYDLEIVTAGDAGAMVAGAVLAAGEPTADALFGIDNIQAGRAEGVFDPYTPEGLDRVPESLRLDDLTPIDQGDVCINIDTVALADAGVPIPTSLDDLTRPEYRDLLVVQDPATSSPGTAFLLATIAKYGDAWPGYWEALRDNGVRVAGSWTQAYTQDFTLNGGDRPLVVSYATSPPAEIVFAADPKPERPRTTVLTDGCYRQVEYAGVLAGAENPDGARAVVDWLLSAPVQADLPLSMFVLPVVEGTPLPEVFTQFAATVDEPLSLPPADVAAGLTDWLGTWGEVMGR
jgi:thiamine transport system substrate-binding protein